MKIIYITIDEDGMIAAHDVEPTILANTWTSPNKKPLKTVAQSLFATGMYRKALGFLDYKWGSSEFTRSGALTDCERRLVLDEITGLSVPQQRRRNQMQQRIVESDKR